MSENWTREDMVRMMGSEKGADMAKLAADALARVDELERLVRVRGQVLLQADALIQTAEQTVELGYDDGGSFEVSRDLYHRAFAEARLDGYTLWDCEPAPARVPLAFHPTEEALPRLWRCPVHGLLEPHRWNADWPANTGYPVQLTEQGVTHPCPAPRSDENECCEQMTRAALDNPPNPTEGSSR